MSALGLAVDADARARAEIVPGLDVAAVAVCKRPLECDAMDCVGADGCMVDSFEGDDAVPAGP
jgi:hypothetical protein